MSKILYESLFDNSIKYTIPGFSSIGFCKRFAISDFEVYLTKFSDARHSQCTNRSLYGSKVDASDDVGCNVCFAIKVSYPERKRRRYKIYQSI
eukprot:165103_1